MITTFKDSLTHIYLGRDQLSLQDAVKLAHNNATFTLSQEARNKITSSRKIVEKIIALNKPTYGINTGFRFFANTTISLSSLIQLQTNIIKKLISSKVTHAVMDLHFQ